MQTFLPFENFAKSAKCLDRQRLGKQRVEVLQILRTLAGLTDGWANHPAVKMWRGHELVLVQYGVAMCDEWISRGYVDRCREQILTLGKHFLDADAAIRPDWLGDPEFHRSHQSNLVRKDPSHYFFDVPMDLPYVWPIERK